MDYKMKLQEELSFLYKKTKKFYDDYRESLKSIGVRNARYYSDVEKETIHSLEVKIATIEEIQNLVDKLN